MSWWRRVLNLPPTGTSWTVYEEQRRSSTGPPAADRSAASSAGRRTPAMAGATQTVPSTKTVKDVPATGIPEGWQLWEGPEPDEVRPGQPIEIAGQWIVPEFETGTTSGPPSDHGHHRPQMVERPADPVPWAPVAVRRPATVWHYVLRGALIAVAIFVFATGLREIFWPDGFGGTDTQQAADAPVNFPSGEASQVAARFTASYLTWDERRSDDRSAATGQDLATGIDPTIGWSGQGVQAVRGIYPGQVTASDATHARVLVLARVAPFTGSGQTWKEQPARWLRLSVPVVVGPTRVVVAGAPALVADSPGEAPAAPPPVTGDDQLTEATESDARAFFAAFASSDEATAAIAAPKARITSLRNAVQLTDLTSWTVDEGDADRRTAHATITWTLTGTATQLSQNYDLTLLRTSAADGTERWQVAELQNN